MREWNKTKRTALENGSVTVRYESGNLAIESRKRPIPHANRSGFWMYTSYYLIRSNGTEKEYHSLADAKRAAEEITE